MLTDTKSAASAVGGVGRGSEDVLQVVEERLNVGKRAVSRGKVRLHSYVVESAVSEDVTLRDETVTIDRHAVDRPVAALGADAFQERTIELEEIDEEAVVSKTARVVEEIGIRKDVSDRTETVRDTVRSTKVDVEDGRTVGTAATVAGYIRHAPGEGHRGRGIGRRACRDHRPCRWWHDEAEAHGPGFGR